MRVAVTGASGFIAQHTINRIVETTDWDVVALSRKVLPERSRVENVRCDLLLPSRLPVVDAIVSLASEVDVAAAIASPRATLMNNASIASRVVEWAGSMPSPARVVHVSTAEVFGPGGPYGLEEPPRPTNPYAVSKAAQDAVFHCARVSGLPVVTARTANVFGEHQPDTKLIPTIVRNLLAGDPVRLFGDAQRRHIHADDVGDALIRMVQHPHDMNVTGADLVPNARIVHMVGERLGIQPVIEVVDEHRPGHEAVYDLTPSEGMTDDLEHGLDRAVAWFAR